MTIKAALQTVRVNQHGYASIKVGGQWYGADKKNFSPVVTEGDLVEFEEFKNQGGYATYKTATFKVVNAANSGSASPSAPNARAAASRTGSTSSQGGRDSYWSDKATEDAKRDPRISYFASLERAIQFVDLALRNGAINAYEKAKATGKLEVLTALVYETTQRIMREAYTQEIPKAEATVPPKVQAQEPEQQELESDPEENWS